MLSETNVKSGFILGPSVQVRTRKFLYRRLPHFSSHQSEISGVTEALGSQTNAEQDRIFDHVALVQLENIMGEIFARRAENTPVVP